MPGEYGDVEVVLKELIQDARAQPSTGLFSREVSESDTHEEEIAPVPPI